MSGLLVVTSQSRWDSGYLEVSCKVCGKIVASEDIPEAPSSAYYESKLTVLKLDDEGVTLALLTDLTDKHNCPGPKAETGR